MDLGTSQVDVKTFRASFDCFNTHGAVQGFVDLFNKLPDERLKPFVDIFNTDFLNNKKLLYELKATHSILKKQKIAESAFLKLGKLLENEDFFASGLALLKKGFLEGKGSEPNQKLLRVIELAAKELDPETVRRSLEFGMAVSGSATYQDLLNDFKGKTNDSDRSLAELTEAVHDYIQDYFPAQVNSTQGSTHSVSADLTEWLRHHSLFDVVDRVMGANQQEIREKVPVQAALFEALLRPTGPVNATHLEKFSEVFYGLNQHGVKISCLKGAQTISHLDMYLMQEINQLNRPSDAADYVFRQSQMNLLAMSPFCDFPAELVDSLPKLMEFAKLRMVKRNPIAEANGVSRSVMEPMADLIQTLWKVTPTPNGERTSASGEEVTWVKFLVKLMADRGAEAQRPDRRGILRLIPVLQELTERKVWTDLFLVLTLPEGSTATGDRKLIQGLLKFMIQSVPTTPSREGGVAESTVFDVLMQSVSRGDSLHLLSFIKSLQTYIDLEDGFLEKTLTTLRQAYYATDVHPVLDLAQTFMSHASDRVELFKTVFEASELPEFRPALRLFSQMAKNGQMIDLLDAIFRISDQFVNTGSEPREAILSKTPPSFKPITRHSLRTSGLETFRVEGGELAQFNIHADCNEVRLNSSLDPIVNPAGYRQSLEHLMNCLNSHGGHPNLSADVQFLRGEDRTFATDPGPRFYQFQARLMRDFFLGTPGTAEEPPFEGVSEAEVKSLKTSWMTSFVGGRFDNLLKAVRYWTHGGEGAPLSMAPAQSVLRPLFETFKHLTQQDKPRLDLRELGNYAAGVIRADTFPQLLVDLEDLFDRPAYPIEPSPVYLFSDLTQAEMRRWVESKECTGLPDLSTGLRAQLVEEKVQRVIRDSTDALTDFEVVPGENGDLDLRKSWKVDDLKDWINPVLDKIRNRHESDVNRSILDASAEFFRFYSLKPGEALTSQAHGSPEALAEWFHAVSADYKPHFIFQGHHPDPSQSKLQDSPQVVWDNLLGRLSKLSWAVHFTGPLWPADLALDFWRLIGQAWGDLPENLWPEEIKRDLERGLLLKTKNQVTGRDRPYNLKEVVEEILDRKWKGGLPDPAANLTFLTNQLGLPPLPACHRDLDTQDDPKIPPNPGSFTKHVFGGQLKQLQQRLWNIHQTKAGLEEAASEKILDPITAYEFRKLAVFRDLFFTFYYSSPEAVRNHFPALKKDKNNLTVLLDVLGMGGMKAISKVMRSVDPKDPVVISFFHALVRGGMSQEMNSFMTALVGKEPKDSELFWAVLRKIFDQMDSRRPEDLWVLKQLGLYSFAATGKLDPSVLNLALERLSQIMKNDDDRDFLTQHIDLLEDGLKVREVPAFLRALFEGPEEPQDFQTPEQEQQKEVRDKERQDRISELLRGFLLDQNGPDKIGRVGIHRLQNAMNVVKRIYEKDGENQVKVKDLLVDFKGRVDAVMKDPGFPKEDMTQKLRSILRFLQQRSEKGGSPPAQVDIDLAKKIRIFAAKLLSDGEVDELIWMIGQNPDQFDHLLRTLGDSIGVNLEDGDLKKFLKVLRRSLSELNH